MFLKILKWFGIFLLGIILLSAIIGIFSNKDDTTTTEPTSSISEQNSDSSNIVTLSDDVGISHDKLIKQLEIETKSLSDGIDITSYDRQGYTLAVAQCIVYKKLYDSAISTNDSKVIEKAEKFKKVYAKKIPDFWAKIRKAYAQELEKNFQQARVNVSVDILPGRKRILRLTNIAFVNEKAVDNIIEANRETFNELRFDMVQFHTGLSLEGYGGFNLPLTNPPDSEF